LLEPVQARALDWLLDVWHTQELPTAGQFGADVATGQESVMANADEPLGQNVEKEPSDELVRGQRHHLGTMAVGPRATKRELAMATRWE
jgi:hypothetical protein